MDCPHCHKSIDRAHGRKETEMTKSEISSKSSARTREQVLARNPRAYDGPTNKDVEVRRLKRELANTADHTNKACIEAAIEKLQ